MSSKNAIIDTNLWPMVLVTLRGVESDASFEGYLASLDALFRRRDRFALVIDAALAEPMTAKQRRRKAEWLEQRQGEFRAFCSGIAFVITSPEVRGALTAVLWMQPIAAPWSVHEDRSGAIAWARDQFLATPESRRLSQVG